MYMKNYYSSYISIPLNGPSGVRQMFKSYRLHEKQLAGIAQTMEDLYGKRQPDSANGTSRSRKSKSARALHNDAVFSGVESRQMIKPVTKKWRPSQRAVHPKSAQLSALGKQDLLPVQCVRCGDAFPKADFEYTKKSGLCISCWEIKIKVK